MNSISFSNVIRTFLLYLSKFGDLSAILLLSGIGEWMHFMIIYDKFASGKQERVLSLLFYIT